jgi:hypothetical protein
MTEATAITTVDELPAELRAELVAKREAGTTLAELKKSYPQVAPDVIRAVLPPLPKGTEPKPATRKPRAAKSAETEAKAKGKAATPKPVGNGGTTDKERLALARKVVTARDREGLSWLKIGAEFNLAPGAESAKAGASRARPLYKLVKGADADTGPLSK